MDIEKLEQDEVIYQAGKRAGIREVVECLMKHPEGVYPKSVDGHTFYMRLFGFEQDEWQAQLKIWFKDNPGLLKEWEDR